MSLPGFQVLPTRGKRLSSQMGRVEGRSYCVYARDFGAVCAMRIQPYWVTAYIGCKSAVHISLKTPLLFNLYASLPQNNSPVVYSLPILIGLQKNKSSSPPTDLLIGYQAKQISPTLISGRSPNNRAVSIAVFLASIASFSLLITGYFSDVFDLRLLHRALFISGNYLHTTF
jgi:hypothetical protein